jgi:hypothetical protein
MDDSGDSRSTNSKASSNDLLDEVVKDLREFNWDEEAFNTKEYVAKFAAEHEISDEDAAQIVDAAITIVALEEVDE